MTETDYLLTLDGPIYMANKKQCRAEPYSSKHEEETIADTGHVTEEKRCLHEARHI